MSCVRGEEGGYTGGGVRCVWEKVTRGVVRGESKGHVGQSWFAGVCGRWGEKIGGGIERGELGEVWFYS
ncbi:hypothetical protein [Bartonella sp. WD12.1]|uniref:hypothetical protein n=1 Tax=Bartonella sp. WD12.1 TaxID=1933903 RepID=UPI00130170A2|nr:hypothetical protein [Bartonella sp. WD12.1]